MKNISSCLLLSCTLFFSMTISAQTIYIATSGNDQNDGSAEKPLASLTGARNRLRHLRSQGALHHPQVIIRKGEYQMAEPFILSVEDSGPDNDPIVYKAEAGATPVFYGGKILPKFEKVSEDLWKTYVPEVRQLGWYFEQLYINGARAVRAKSPNKRFYQPKSITETVMVPGIPKQRHGFAVQKIVLPPGSVDVIKNLSDAELHDAVISFYHNWDNTIKYISSFDSGGAAVFTSGGQMKPWNPVTTRSLFTIENTITALDAPGEWFLDRLGVLYYKPLPGQTPENTKCIAPLAQKLMVISGNESTGETVKNVRFENLSFQHTAFHLPISGAEPEQAAASVEAAIQLDFSDKIDFINCEVAHTGGAAIWYRRGCSQGKVQHCFIHDIGASAIKIGETVLRPRKEELTRGILVDNNIITSGGHVFPCAVAVIIFHGSDNTISHNEIADHKYSGLSVGWIWGYAPSPSKRNTIEFNHIHHLGWGVLSDMGGVYTLGASEGTVVRNNTIHHIYSYDYGGWGLYTDEGSFGIIMENNLVYNCKSSGFHQHYGKENRIRNNIFANNIKAQLQATRVEKHQSFSFTNNIVYFSEGTLLSSKWDSINALINGNCYWNTRGKEIMFGRKSFKQWQQEGKDKESLIADPGFVDAEHYDFRFKNKKLQKAIGFMPFNYSDAGVYGSAEWKKKAEMDQALMKEYDERVKELELRKNEH